VRRRRRRRRSARRRRRKEHSEKDILPLPSADLAICQSPCLLCRSLSLGHNSQTLLRPEDAQTHPPQSEKGNIHSRACLLDTSQLQSIAVTKISCGQPSMMPMPTQGVAINHKGHTRAAP